MDKQKIPMPFIDANGIMELLHVSRSKAYQLISQCNAEMEAQGFFVLKGKTNTKFLLHKFGLKEEYHHGTDSHN